MPKYLLSLCIPTYNRAAYLKNSLETIICQDAFKTGEVEIVISDNASTDDTEEIGREYARQFANVLYFRNEKNIVNDNFPLALSRANGTLRRLCNDTLCYREGSLRRMCDAVSRYKDVKPYLCWMGVEGEKLFEEVDFCEGIRKISYWMTSIGSFSIWDTECHGIEKDTAGAELMLWQVRKALELASEKDRIVLVNEDLSYTPKVRGRDVSYGLYHVFYDNYFQLLEPYFENGQLTAEDREALEKDLFLDFFPAWCARWKAQKSAMQYSGTEDLCKCVECAVENKPYRKDYQRIFRKRYVEERTKRFIKGLIGRD